MESIGYSNILQNCIENLLLAEDHLQNQSQDNPMPNGEHYFTDLSQFWREIDVISKKLSYECTKICISITTSPLPTSEEMSFFLQGIEHAVLAFVSVALKFQPAFGKVLHQRMRNSVISAIQMTRQLIRVIKDDGGSGVEERYRHATGIAWEGCKNLQACPKDNKEAVQSYLADQSSMISDAFDEISEALEGDGSGWDSFGLGASDSDGEQEEEAKWSEEDKATINPTVNIIKAAKILYGKTIAALAKNGFCDTEEQICELDQLLEDFSPISQTIDSLILEIYPPLNVDNMNMQTQALASHLHTAIKTATRSHVITENEKATVEFIKKAVDHNLDKMKDILRSL